LRFRLKIEGTTWVLLADNADVPSGDWFYAVGAYAGNGMQIYIDGNPNGSNSRAGTVSRDGSKQAWIGSNPTNGYETWEGFIGEVRISNIGRSPDWIAAQWRSFSGTFVTIEDEVSR
ncbi:MAG: LamG domain-containing protein, partial [Deltaproteobacteria bacterium]|nr:LamG domain-containing protein [Deltaproteobacteria bacterium]